MIVVDTTVLLYAVGGAHALQTPCRWLVEKIGSGEVRATTTPQVIQEFVHVYARRRGRGESARLGRNWCGLLSPLLTSSREELEQALDLYETHSDLGAFDALLAATALTHELDGLASADRAFGAVDRLDHFDPAASSFADVANS